MQQQDIATTILDQNFRQRSIGVTPFSSEKSSNRSYEPVHLLSVREGDASTGASIGGAATYRMNFPVALCSNIPGHSIEPSRAHDNVLATEHGVVPETEIQLASQPNQYWQLPPPVGLPVKDDLAAHAVLARDTLHPQLSAMQAAENAKAASFNPTSAYRSNARRDGRPCDSHALVRGGGGQQNATTVLGDGDGEDGEDDDMGMGTTVRGGLKQSRRGDLKTAIGRAYNSDGAYHDAEQYSGKVVEFAATQPTAPTDVAAKALASAIHDHPSHAIPANAAASRAIEPLPNSGPTGTNTNRYTFSGISDESNPVTAPPPAFRSLHPVVQGTLLRRTRDTRTALTEFVSREFPPMQPPPVAYDPDKGQEVAAAHHPTAHPRRGIFDEDDQDDVENIDELLFAGGSLSVWSRAMQRRGPRRQVPQVPLPPTHPMAHMLGTRSLRVLTPSLVSLYKSSSARGQAARFLGGVGLRMDDAMTQPKPPSQSSFLTMPERAKGLKQFANIQHTPSNVFGFDNERFSMLLAEKGEEVEEINFEGATHISEAALANIGRYCPQLKLLNLAGCHQLTGETVQAIADQCKLLAYVNLSDCKCIDGAGVAYLLEKTTNMHALCLSALPLLDAGLEMAFMRLHQHQALAVLDLSFCDDVTDNALVQVAQYCPALEVLDISGCVNVGDIGIASIGSSCAALKVLKMQLCTAPTKAGLATIGVAARNLEILDFSGCTQLTVDMFKDMVKRLACLKALFLGGCTGIKDEAVACISKVCKQLVMLNLSSCVGVGLDSCMELIHDLQCMRRLVVSESSISNAEVVILSSLRENCKIIRNQFRHEATQRMIGYKMPEVKKAAPKGKGDKKKK